MVRNSSSFSKLCVITTSPWTCRYACMFLVIKRLFGVTFVAHGTPAMRARE